MAVAFCAASNRCCIFCPVKGDNVVNCRCGPLIDLCRGPHVRHTGKIKALKIHKVSPQSVGCAVHFKVPLWEENQELCVGPCSKCGRRRHICPRFQSRSTRCVSLWGGCDAPKGTVETNIVPAVCLSVCVCARTHPHTGKGRRTWKPSRESTGSRSLTPKC